MIMFRIMSPEEEAEYKRKCTPPEIQAEIDYKKAWNKKHPRCYECGQFLKKNTDPFGPEWVSHFYRSSYEYNEWDHK